MWEGIMLFLELCNDSRSWENVVNGTSFGIEHPQALSPPAVGNLGQVIYFTLTLSFLTCETGRIVKMKWDLVEQVVALNT